MAKMLEVYITNEAARVTDDEGLKVTYACQIQIARDFAPIWGVSAVLHYVPKGQAAPVDSIKIRLVDRSDLDGALGYHDEQSDIPAGIVGVDTCIEDGVSWSSCLSHEVMELVADPECVRCFQHGGEVVALEPGDPCEGITYKIGDVEVQGFATPAYYVENAHGPYSFPDELKSGYPTLASGGYNLHAQVGAWGQETAACTRSAKQKLTGRRAKRAGW